jgi:hypothetical protein
MGIGHEEWLELPWHIRRAYLEGMETDESVPLTFEQQDMTEGMPEDMRWQQREAEGAAVIDVGSMISELEASRGSGGR